MYIKPVRATEVIQVKQII